MAVVAASHNQQITCAHQRLACRRIDELSAVLRHAAAGGLGRAIRSIGDRGQYGSAGIVIDRQPVSQRRHAGVLAQVRQHGFHALHRIAGRAKLGVAASNPARTAVIDVTGSVHAVARAASSPGTAFGTFFAAYIGARAVAAHSTASALLVCDTALAIVALSAGAAGAHGIVVAPEHAFVGVGTVTDLAHVIVGQALDANVRFGVTHRSVAATIFTGCALDTFAARQTDILTIVAGHAATGAASGVATAARAAPRSVIAPGSAGCVGSSGATGRSAARSTSRRATRSTGRSAATSAAGI